MRLLFAVLASSCSYSWLGLAPFDLYHARIWTATTLRLAVDEFETETSRSFRSTRTVGSVLCFPPGSHSWSPISVWSGERLLEVSYYERIALRFLPPHTTRSNPISLRPTSLEPTSNRKKRKERVMENRKRRTRWIRLNWMVWWIWSRNRPLGSCLKWAVSPLLFPYLRVI